MTTPLGVFDGLFPLPRKNFDATAQPVRCSSGDARLMGCAGGSALDEKCSPGRKLNVTADANAYDATAVATAGTWDPNYRAAVLDEGCAALNALSRARAGTGLIYEDGSPPTPSIGKNVHRAALDRLAWSLELHGPPEASLSQARSLADLLHCENPLEPTADVRVRPFCLERLKLASTTRRPVPLEPLVGADAAPIPR